jgi:para-nitrobenzyl esterase
MKSSLLLIASFALAAVGHASNNAFPVQTVVEQGTLEGNYDTKTGLQTYFGIPFAQPPVGDLRWKAPQPPAKWDGVRPAKHFAPRAMQAPVFGDMMFESDGINEDCLYLNVWTPAKHDTTGLPVLVYFYGGGYVAGDGSEPRYNGAALAAKGIVAVTVNYRLNIFGFLADPELSAEAPYKASGNYGVLDQVAALRWVHENVKAFGGDPNKITIAGESAGSVSVSYVMASPLSKDLIAGAIGESGAGIGTTLLATPLAEAEKQGHDFLKQAGFNSIAEARKAPARVIYEVYNASHRFGFPIVLDGYLLPKTLPEIFEAKQQAQVPLLVGWNSAEVPAVAFMQRPPPYDDASYVAAVKAAYPNQSDEILKLYPHGSPEEIDRSATALASDRFIAYSTWRWFDLQRKNSPKPVYRYLFSRIRPPLKDDTLQSGLAGGVMKKPAGAPAFKQLGAPHACEIEYVLGNLPLSPQYAFTEDDFKVSETATAYFANFIKTGNPNGKGLPEWPAAKPDDRTPPVMILDVTSEAKNAENDARYEFLKTTY